VSPKYHVIATALHANENQCATTDLTPAKSALENGGPDATIIQTLFFHH
jgi:hypothetical protein